MIFVGFYEGLDPLAYERYEFVFEVAIEEIRHEVCWDFRGELVVWSECDLFVFGLAFVLRHAFVSRDCESIIEHEDDAPATIHVEVLDWAEELGREELLP